MRSGWLSKLGVRPAEPVRRGRRPAGFRLELERLELVERWFPWCLGKR